jgi:V/A-type H+-transporting ATPase subunit I
LAIARLSRVTLETSRGELGLVLAKIIRFGTFHPSRREGMVQDIGMLVLASRAQAVSSKAGELLGKEAIKGPGSRELETFEAHTIGDLVNSLEEYVDIIEKNLSLFTDDEDRKGAENVLLAVQEASAMVFEDLQRILVYPPRDGSLRLEGFIPSSSVKSFRTEMGRFLHSIEPVKSQSRDDPYVPSLLVNPRIISIFEDLTLQRGLPRYGQVDPTPILAFVFPLFFGIMFSDVGHGIALFALGLFLIYRTAYRNWGELILVLGSSTTVFGFIRGSFFGITFVSPLARLIHLPPALAAGFTLSSIPLLLEVSIVVGTFHLGSGYAIAFLNQERSGNYLDAFLNRLPTVVLYASMIPLGFAVVGTGLNLGVLLTSMAPTPVFDDLLGVRIPVSATARFSLPVVAATLFFLVIGHPIREYQSTRNLRRAADAAVSGLADALAKPFEFFINTISYIRLGVLLITTTLLGSLVAGLMSEGIVGVLAAAFVNVAVIGLEGVIVYIQDMRLQLYEWFSQFYSGNGTPFAGLISGGGRFRVRWT